MAVNIENLWKIGLHDNVDFVRGVNEMPDEELINKICESSNLPHDSNGNKIIHNNEHFHCSQNGCDIEMRLVRTDYYGDYSVHKFCHTHNKECSRTGWEFGWYMGNKKSNHKKPNNVIKFRRSISAIAKLRNGILEKTSDFYKFDKNAKKRQQNRGLTL